MNKIKVHYIDTPLFTVNGKEYRMETSQLSSFSKIEDMISYQLRKANKLGYKIELVIMSISNMHCDKPIIKCLTDKESEVEYLGMIRYKFFKSDDNHLPIAYHQDGVAFYSEGLQISKSEYQNKIINKRLKK